MAVEITVIRSKLDRIKGMTMLIVPLARSASLASGEVSSLTRATVRAPPCLAASTAASRSGLLPDYEIAR